MKNQPLRLKIVSKMGVEYEDMVSSVTTVNAVGTMDILANHEWFISPIFEKVVVKNRQGETRVWSINNAILRVKENAVEIFIGE